MSARHSSQGGGLARGLGWFSLALGAAQVGAPKVVNRLIGVATTDASKDLMRAIGVREFAAGVGILTRGRPAGFLWARVAGDAMDLALLGNGLTSGSNKGRAGVAAAAVAGVTALDVVAVARRRATGTPTPTTTALAA